MGCDFEDKERDDNGRRRGALVAGILLILVGAFFLAVQWIPGLHVWVSWEQSWPLAVIAVAALLAIIGLASQEPDMAIPVVIVGGIGGILYWQNITGNWGSWAYIWSLIPGFVGVGMIVAALFRGLTPKARRMLVEGFSNIITSIALFAVFGSFLGGPSWLGRYWPLAVVLVGLWVLANPRRWNRKHEKAAV